ncbi:MAG TPA: radical SAM protein [Candidatus Omnitrophota bacterium]|nr:radical SAM protein [Candidatus Omnitrophota bacterium]
MIPKNSDMRFEVTTRCNYDCIICPHRSLTRKIETMSLELFKHLFDKIMFETKQYHTLTFPGMGEPLLDPDLDKKILYAKKRFPQMKVLILTNGSLLDWPCFRHFEKLGVESIRVSLYGIQPDSYAQVHGIKNKRRYIHVRDNLIKISKEKTSTKLLLTFNAIRGENELDVSGWIDFWKDKVDLLEVWRPHNWVDAKDYRKIQKKMLKTCGRPFNGPLQIQVDGTVNMCCFDYDGKLTLGDLKKQTLKEIFSSDIFKRLSERHTTGQYKDSEFICRKCDQRNEDKTDVMIYNSKFSIEERVKMISTTYAKIEK